MTTVELRNILQNAVFRFGRFFCFRYASSDRDVRQSFLMCQWFNVLPIVNEFFHYTARLLAGCVTTLRLSHPLSVSQHGQLSHPSLRGR